MCRALPRAKAFVQTPATSAKDDIRVWGLVARDETGVKDRASNLDSGKLQDKSLVQGNLRQHASSLYDNEPGHPTQRLDIWLREKSFVGTPSQKGEEHLD